MGAENVDQDAIQNTRVRRGSSMRSMQSLARGTVVEPEQFPLKNQDEKTRADIAARKQRPISGKDWILLLLVGSLAAGNGYIITCVQSFEPVLQSRYNYNAFTVSTLNSIVSIPKIFTSFLEGYLLTKFGFVMAVIITSVALLGQLLYCIGIMFDCYPVSVMGRFVVGAEFNMMFTTQYLITLYYFKDRFPILSNCVNYIFTILFCIIACYFNPILVDYFRDHLTWPLVISLVPAVFSWVTSIILWRLKKINFNEEERTSTDIKLEEQRFKISDIKRMPALYWVMVIQEVTLLNSFMNFIYMGTYYGIARFNEHYLVAKNMPTLMNVMIMPVLIFLTVFSEKIGKRGFALVIANLLNVVGAIWLLSMGTNDGAQYPWAVVVVGISFGIYTSYSWPVLSMTVPVELITFGMTLCLVLESCVEFVLPLIVGWLDIPRDNEAYLKSTWIVFVLGCIGLIASIVVYFMDVNGSKVLHNTPEEEEAQAVAQEEAAREEAEQEEKRGLKDEEGTPADNAEPTKKDSSSGLAAEPENTSIAVDQTPKRDV
jgi:hypothetical protein